MAPKAKTPTCHPERKHRALGKCRQCYYADYTSTPAEKNRKGLLAKAAWTRPEVKAADRRKNLRNYGLVPEDYDAMLVAQGGTCAICGNPPKKNRLSVDHDHVTGAVRGLLCIACNNHLGWLENADWVASARQYLVTPPGVPSVSQAA